MDTREQVQQFLSKCAEMKKCKFIMATTKIKDLLKCIVNSPELYGLFESATKNFNYPEMRSRCLVSYYDGTFRKSRIVLPQTVGDRLAFIFCLLAEFDGGTLGLNEFLRQYFSEEGSYYASYRAFCDIIINGLEDSIAQVFEEELAEQEERTQNVAANSLKAELLSVLNLAIAEERQFVLESKVIPEDDKEGGVRILSQLSEAIKAENIDLIDALICGYNYFVLYHKSVSDGVGSLIKTIAAYEGEL